MFKTPLKLNMTILIALLLGLTINANANMLKIEGGAYIFDDPLNLVIVRGKVDGTELQLFKDEILGWIGQSEISFSGALSNIPGFKSGQGVGYIYGQTGSLLSG